MSIWLHSCDFRLKGSWYRMKPAQKKSSTVKLGSRAPPVNGKGDKGLKKSLYSKEGKDVKDKVAANNVTNKTEKEESHPFCPSGFQTDFVDMLKQDITRRSSSVRWDDIADFEEAKYLAMAVVLPFKIPLYFQGIRRPWNGALLVGPPGAGKTMLGQAVANECGVTFFNVPSSMLFSKYRCEPKDLIRLLFEMARFYAPAILFFDDIDFIMDYEDVHSVQSELVFQMGAISRFANEDPNKAVMVLAAASNPWRIDRTLLQRFEQRVNIPFPNRNGRLELLKFNLSSVKLASDVDLEELAKMLEGFSGTDIRNVCRKASMMGMWEKVRGLKLEQVTQLALEEIDRPVAKEEFILAMEKEKKSASAEVLERYAQWMTSAHFQSNV